jgi:uncharacterized membrane protein YczE
METGGERRSIWSLILGSAPSLVTGLFIYYLGFVAILNSGLGMYPGGVFTVGVATHAPLTIGQVNQIMQATFLLLGWYLGFPPGLGTLADLTLSGIFIDLLISRGIVPAPTDILGQLLILLLGVGLMGAGTYLYIRVLLGAGPMDGFMLGVLTKTKRPVSVVRGTMEIAFLAAGWALGGPVGVGTIITAITIGYSVQIAFRVGGYDPDSKHINLYDLFRSVEEP